jgi:hypothetical protein
MIRCPNGHEVESRQRFCTACGGGDGARARAERGRGRAEGEPEPERREARPARTRLIGTYRCPTPGLRLPQT